MIEMKVRYGLSNMDLKISNVTPRETQDSYVLITAYDENNNEIAFALSHEQAERLEIELYEANRRWREHSANMSIQYAEPGTESNERMFDTL